MLTKMRKETGTLFIVVIILVIFSSCVENEDNLKDITGTVNYIDLEGGFYGITDEEGNKYDPVNLPEEYKEDGTRVRFSAKKLENYTSIHMWGKIIEITNIDKI